MANVTITNKTDQTLDISLYDQWGNVLEKSLAAGQSTTELRERVTSRTLNLGRQGHLRILHSP